jgi:hypothetical protein
MERYTGATLVLTSTTAMVWSIALLGLQPSWTTTALASGCGGIATATLALLAQRGAWDQIQRVVNQTGPLVLAVPPAAGFVVGSIAGLAATSLGALFGPQHLPTPAATVAGALAGLALWSWHHNLDEDPFTVERRQLTAEGSTGEPLGLEGGPASPASLTATGERERCNYDGRLHLTYDATPTGAIVGTVSFHFAPTHLDQRFDFEASAATAPVVVDDGTQTDLVPFTVTAYTTSPLRVVPPVIRLVVPTNGISAAHRFSLFADERRAEPVIAGLEQQVIDGFSDRDLGYVGGIVRIEIAQGGRRVQLAEISIPGPGQVWQTPHPRHPKIGHY